MAVENNLQLISYFAAADIYNKDKNIYECFLPIVESALLCVSNKSSISFLGLQKELQDIYHLDVPRSTLKKLLERLATQKKIKFSNKRNITLCRNELNDTFFDKRQEHENLIEDFFITFNLYLVKQGISVPLSDIKKFCCEWLYTHSLELTYFINSGNLKDDASKNNWEYTPHLVSFLLEVYEEKSIYFETFLSLYNGAIQSALLNFETEQISTVCDSSLQLKNVILDTNFILRMLNLQSEFDWETAKETIEMLKNEGTHFYILEQTLTEIQNTIQNFLDDSQYCTRYVKKFFGGSQIKMTGFLEAERRGVSKSELYEKTKKSVLKSSILQIIDVTFVDDFDDTEINKSDIDNLVISKNKDSYGDKQARHDLCLIEYCRKNRKKNIKNITEIDWWVITNDERLTFWNQKNSNEYQECLTEIQLSNITWIQKKKNGNASLMQTIVSLSNGGAITAKELESFIQKIHNFQEKNKDDSIASRKLSLVFANNMLKTSDIQKVNENEDILNQMLNEKVVEIQLEQENQEKKLSSENDKLMQELDELSMQLKIEYTNKIKRYEDDILKIRKEIEINSEKLNSYQKLEEHKEKIDKSTGRYVIISFMFSFAIIIIIYANFGGYSFVLSFLGKMKTMPDFIRDIACTIIAPAVLDVVYYFIVGSIFGNIFSPKELFNLCKSKLLDRRLKKYVKSNNLPIEYVDRDIKSSISSLNADIRGLEQQIEELQKNINEIKKKV